MSLTIQTVICFSLGFIILDFPKQNQNSNSFSRAGLYLLYFFVAFSFFFFFLVHAIQPEFGTELSGLWRCNTILLLCWVNNKIERYLLIACRCECICNIKCEYESWHCLISDYGRAKNIVRMERANVYMSMVCFWCCCVCLCSCYSCVSYVTRDAQYENYSYIIRFVFTFGLSCYRIT